MKQTVFTIQRTRPLTADVYEMTLRGDASSITAPGQFVNAALPGRFLRRPISVCDWTADSLLLLVRVAGEGTRELVGFAPGTELDVLCGLGNGFDTADCGPNPILIGGGVGVAPLFGLARRLLAQGVVPTAALGFRTAADAFYLDEFAALGCRPRTTRRLAGYSSWYNRYQNIDEASIREDLNGCKTLFRAGDLFQIDDGWERKVGDWLEPDPAKFPNGLRPLAEAAHENGFLAGLWLAPFVCEKESLLCKDHPDWLLQADGQPWCCGCNWSSFYALDIDHPEVQAYLRQVFDRVLQDWGFDLVKLDFLYGAAPFGNARESRAGRMQRAMALLRSWCGDKLILGCGVPVMPAFGIVDYCRVGCDVGLDWDDVWYMRLFHRERVSTKQSIGNTIFRRQLNGRAYGSDPDVFFLREENCKLTAQQKQTLARVNALFSGILLTSDMPSRYTDEMRRQYNALRELTEHAENCTVDADDGLTIHYTLHGKQQAIKVF